MQHIYNWFPKKENNQENNIFLGKVMLALDFSESVLCARSQWEKFSKLLRKRQFVPRMFHLSNLSFKSKSGKLKLLLKNKG